MSRTSPFFNRAACAVACGIVALLLGACADVPVRQQLVRFQPLPLAPAGEIQYCFNGSPPLADATPFVFGGRDLSIPTKPDVAAAYKELGVVWAGNGCVPDANGYTIHGPHVAFGGLCLDPPPPGTKEYNDIVMGVGVTNMLYPQWRQRHGQAALAH